MNLHYALWPLKVQVRRQIASFGMDAVLIDQMKQKVAVQSGEQLPKSIIRQFPFSLTL